MTRVDTVLARGDGQYRDVLLGLSHDRHRHLRLAQSLVIIKVRRPEAAAQHLALLLGEVDLVVLGFCWSNVLLNLLDIMPQLDLSEAGDQEEDHSAAYQGDVSLVSVSRVFL